MRIFSIIWGLGMWSGSSASSWSAICYSQPVSQLGSYANAPSCIHGNNMIYPPATGDLLFSSCSSYPAYLMLPVVHIPHRPQGQTDRQTERRSVCDVGSIFHFLDVHLYYLIKVRLVATRSTQEEQQQQQQHPPTNRPTTANKSPTKV